MKKSILLIIALLGAMVWTGCQRMEEERIQEKTKEVTQEATTYNVTILAERIPGQVGNDGASTKGLEIGDGGEAATTQLKSVWKADEPVLVYLGTDCIGTLTATPDGTDAHKATLSGTVTTTSITPNTTTLTLLTPRESWDYTGQIGKLLLSDDATDSIEKKYHYTKASPVLVTGATDDGAGHWTITTDPATFSNQQSIYRMSFKYSGSGITTKSVTISGASNKLVQSQAVDGSSLVEGPISATLGTATQDPFFVALRNGDETNTEVLTFTVVDDSGVTYRGTKEIPAGYKPNGTFVSVKNTNLTERMDLVLSATTVNTVL